jgi:hypothetical protein
MVWTRLVPLPLNQMMMHPQHQTAGTIIHLIGLTTEKGKFRLALVPLRISSVN